MRRVLLQDQACRGLTLIEVMVSITVLFLGVMTAGGMMISVQHAAGFFENRYQDYSDVRSRVESLRAQMSTAALQSGSLLSAQEKFTTPPGHAGRTNFELQPAGLSNLVRLELVVQQDNGAGPVQVVTYLRTDDD